MTLEFAEIFIPGELLNKNSFFDQEKKIWTWIYKDFKAFYFENQKIRLKINDIKIEKNQENYFLIG